MSKIDEYVILLTYKSLNGTNLIMKVKWYKQKSLVQVFKYIIKDGYKEIAYSFKYVFILHQNKTLQTLPDSPRMKNMK